MTVTGPDPEFEHLLDHLRRTRGFDFTGYKRVSLVRLVRRRMLAADVATFSDYLDRLQTDPEEFSRLFDTMLINVTSFFRDPAAWAELRTVQLPAMLDRLGPDAPIRVWVPGCATGEEAYSHAIALCELLGPDAFRRRAKIYATDVDETALAVARTGRYPRAAFDAVDPDLVARYFEETPDGLAFRPDLRQTLIFGRHDVIQDAPISRITLLSCRNVIMYFDAETQARVLHRFAFALTDPGLLFLGKAEMLLTHGGLFAPVDLRHRMFHRVGTPLRPVTVGASVDVSFLPDQLTERLGRAAFMDGPEAQVVLDGEGRLALVNQAGLMTLGLAGADIGRPFRDLELSYRPVELRAGIAQAVESGLPVELTNVAWTRDGSESFFDLRITALPVHADEPPGAQVTFRDVSRYRLLQQELETAHRNLEMAYEELQSTNEELETTNEELQSTIEELETTNEELQSTNEELETMNAELQSTNDELQVLNDQLRDRTGEVGQANAFMESILRGLRGGVVVLDRDLVVRVWNARAEKMWGLRAHEAIGEHLLNLDIGLPVATLRGLLRTTMSGDQDAVEAQVPATNRLGRNVVCSISATPVRGAGGEVDGAFVLMEELAVPESSTAS